MSEEDEIILADLDDEELVQQMFDDLYDGLREEIEEGVNILIARKWAPYDVLTKALVAQCTGGLKYSGCRRRDQCSAEEKRQLKYLQSPFFVGLTVASEDIEWCVLDKIKHLKIGLANMIDAPTRGDASLDMCKTHGKAWTAWQEVSISPIPPQPRRAPPTPIFLGAAASGGLPSATCCLPRTRPARGGVAVPGRAQWQHSPAARCATPGPACPAHQPPCAPPRSPPVRAARHRFG